MLMKMQITLITYKSTIENDTIVSFSRNVNIAYELKGANAGENSF